MLKNAFQVQYKGIIWKIRPDETGSHLVLEIRNAEKKVTFFSCIHTEKGALTFDQLQLQEPWFCGLEGVAHGMAYLHGYLSETLPEHRGIFAVHLKNGRIAWEDYNLVFSHAAKEGLLAWNYKSEPRRYQLIDPENGRSIRFFSSPEELEEATSPLSPPPLYFPSKTTLGADWLAHLPAEVLPAADLLEWKEQWIEAFYTNSKGVDTSQSGKVPAGTQKMDHHLYIFDRNRRLIHKDLLAKDILQPAMDTFFVMGNQVYYIKSKSEFLAYFL